ncbi:MAG: methyltransferase domain-containing protein [Bryobacteraceae bacterium]
MLKSVAYIGVIVFLLTPLASAQTAEERKVWEDFVATCQSDPSGVNPANYRQRLIQAGMTEAQADERMALLHKLYDAYPAFRQQIGIVGSNHLYRDPNQTRFTTDPSAFLVAMTKDLKPGKALDVAMGQGRNVLYLASKGWDVTGFDIAEEGLKVAQANAAKSGLAIKTVKAGWDDFDFGHEQWDLICFIYTDAPVIDPRFVARVRDGLKTGGLLLMDRPYRSLDHPEPNWRETEADKANAWLKAWSDLQIVNYEDTTGVGDWQQTAVRRQEYRELRLVHMLARKR